ncbi:MAG: LPS export ABC transporter permease LptF [Gammaproteobacteria bacterium]
MIISRYLLREIILALLAVSGVLYVIYVSNRLIRFFSNNETSGLPAAVIPHLVALKSLSNLMMLLPLAFFIAVLIALGRLYKDNEIVALAACGVGEGRLRRTILWMAFGFAGVVAALSLYAGPLAEELSYRIQDRVKANVNITSIAAGRFREMHNGKMVFYVENMSDDHRTLQNVFVKTIRNGVLNVVTAERGRRQFDPKSGDTYLILENGYRYEGQPGDSQFKIIHFAKHGILLEEQAVTPTARNVAASPTPALWGNPGNYQKAELQWRIAMPLATILLAALAVPLSRSGPRQGRFAKMFIAVVIYAIYVNFLAVARSWVERGVIPASLGLWWVHGALLTVILALAARQSGLRWLLLRLAGKAPSL